MIHNLTRDTIIANNVKLAHTSGQRMKGLLGKENLPQGEALVITHCQSIHMFFMKFAIDVIFCDAKDKIVGVCKDVKPFQLSPVFFKASYAIELPSGTIVASKTELGDQLQKMKCLEF